MQINLPSERCDSTKNETEPAEQVAVTMLDVNGNEVVVPMPVHLLNQLPSLQNQKRVLPSLDKTNRVQSQ